MEAKLRILNKWSGDDERHYVTTPWYQNEYSYSTDGSCLFRIPGQYGISFAEGKFPNAETSFNWTALEAACNGIQIDKDLFREKKQSNLCRMCSPKSKKNPKTCPECNGEGFECNGEGPECRSCYGTGYEEGLYIPKDCPFCKGTRWAMPRYLQSDERWKIGEKEYNPQYIAIILDNFENVEFFPDIEVCEDAVGFKFSGGMGILMSMRS